MRSEWVSGLYQHQFPGCGVVFYLCVAVLGCWVKSPWALYSFLRPHVNLWSSQKKKSLKIYRTGTSNPNYLDIISKDEAKGTDATTVHYSKERKRVSKERQRGYKHEKKFWGRHMRDRSLENSDIVKKTTGSGMRVNWAHIALTGCVPLGKLLNFSGPQLPRLPNEDDTGPALMLLFWSYDVRL